MGEFYGRHPAFENFYIFSTDLLIFTTSESSIAVTGRKDLWHQQSKASAAIITLSHLKYETHPSLCLMSPCSLSHFWFSVGRTEEGNGTFHADCMSEGLRRRDSFTIRISSDLPVSGSSFIPTLIGSWYFHFWGLSGFCDTSISPLLA